MIVRLLSLCLGISALLLSAATAAPAAAVATAAPAQVVVIPLRDQVAEPMFYILRRGLKEAIEAKADLVVLDLKTPGGALDVTFNMMEAIAKFPGQTITYVNDEAISAGAFLSATTDEIWFSPQGVIGAAAPVQATGAEVEETMRLKITSYLKARIRAVTEGQGLRGQVISAMIDRDYELKVDGEVLKAKGDLLSLTASEAGKLYGTPPQPLLAAGIAADVDALLKQRFGTHAFAVKTLQVTWSEELAMWLQRISTLLLGLGIVALYVEFKTPGFGVFGAAGIVLLSLVFLGNYAAGLSGHEPMLVFIVGVLLVALEIFLFPGVVVAALTGTALILGSLVWSMADLWPNEPIRVAWSGDAFVGPLTNLGAGFLLAAVLVLALARFLPKGWFFNRLAVAGAVEGSAQLAGGAPAEAALADAVVGRTGVALTGLYPSGQVEVDGHHFAARLEIGAAAPGTRVVVRRRTDFDLIVDKVEGGT